ncbi:hypothetical protein BABINDRAFT_170080 [Babjeviella inositovora NRRL Y-12698]|uniref:ribonuclease Z n=1 Tax=Babjeviella inositovora NRRL Y-12698 TaxID=984486 RepID=A0A1E3QZM3_9ASCO|nr:uncharacterized protein BABINDRAFT_170080 [Babjeviella inositovora NRRL Y-12698]ODQ82994.1 hypothetical protein BABINDRAFT_170080 [Babjeviella inositovora NRRL Y-12698]
MYTIRTVCHPTSDITEPLIVLNTEATSHYFGKCAEGAQRNLIEKSVRPSRMKNLFITGILDWNGIGGLPGLILTMGDTGKTNIDLSFGSSILNYMISTWRAFVFRQGITINVNTMPDAAVRDDKYMFVKIVHTVPAKDCERKPLTKRMNDTLAAIVQRMFPLDVPANDPTAGDPAATSPLTNTELPEISNSAVSSSYVIQFKSARGKFSIQKAKALNIPPGPLFAKLTKGESIEVNGVTIMPDQVVAEARKFQRVVVVDIPTPAYLSSTIQSTGWFDPIDPESDNSVGLVYHFLGKDVDITSKEYLRFIKSFGNHCTHIISHPVYCPNTINFKSATISLLKLKSLQKDFFKLPVYSNDPLRDVKHVDNALESLVAYQEVTISPDGITVNNTDTEKNRFTWSTLYDEHVASLSLGCFNEEEILAAPASFPASARDEVEIVTLGTGSAMPSKYRNVLSTLVRIPTKVDAAEYAYQSILLDAGENTYGALCRNHGDDLPFYLRELRLVYLSHLHADHHLGIMTIIKEWFRVQNSSPEQQRHGSLFVVCPWSYNRFVKEWSRLEPVIDFLKIDYVSCQDFLTIEDADGEYATVMFDELTDPSLKYVLPTVLRPRAETRIQKLYAELGLRLISTCKAIHCKWAYSIVLHFHSEQLDFKIAYSGDTRPNIMFAEIAHDSDLLLHEATLEDELIEDAIYKRHSTISEAIYMARLMRAKKLILTHFSQRYWKVPDLNTGETNFAKLKDYLSQDCSGSQENNPGNIFSYHAPTVALDLLYAFDNMMIKYGRLHEQRAISDKLSIVFGTEEENDASLPKAECQSRKTKGTREIL